MEDRESFTQLGANTAAFGIEVRYLENGKFD
jgi:hypothetical protein